MNYQDLFKIIESQQRAVISLQRQILHLATVTGQAEQKDINEGFDQVLQEIQNMRRIMYRQDEEK